MVVGHGTPYQDIDDLRAADSVRFGSTGPGASDFVTASVLIDVLDLTAEIITGYEGSSELELAVTRGDVDAMIGDLSSRLPPVEAGDHRALLLFAEEPAEALPEVPAVTTLESALDEEEQGIGAAHVALPGLGRTVVAPPDV